MGLLRVATGGAATLLSTFERKLAEAGRFAQFMLQFEMSR